MATTRIILGSCPQPQNGPNPVILSPSPLTIKTNLLFSSIARTKPLSHTLAIFPLLDTITWNTVRSAYLHHHRSFAPLHLFIDILISSSSCPHDSIMLRSILRACLRYDNCMLLVSQLHAYVFKLQSALFSASELTGVRTCLLTVCLTCGCTEIACMFVTIPERDVVTCTSMLKAFIEAGENEEALRVLKDKVENEKLVINECILVLCMCVSRDVLFCSKGCRYMPGVVKSAVSLDVFAGTGLVDLYVQSDEMESARKAFPEIADPSVVSYNALLAGNLEGDEGPWLFS